MSKQTKQQGQAQPDDEQQSAPAIEYVMMKRITDGDGPHPIHPDEVQNYIAGDWVVVEADK